jgi:D-alanyl-D-alanine endopeptidase (penicillin-binding protein 7)
MSPFMNALAWTLLHFIWQGALLGGITALLLALLRHARPQTRYALACAALLACLAWPALELAARLSAGEFAGATPAHTAALPHIPGGASTLRHWQHWLVGLWALGAGAMVLRVALGLAWIRRAGADQDNNHPEYAMWQARLSALALRFGVTRPVRLLIAGTLEAPVTAGCWRPLVIVPAALLTGMPADLLEALLAHEMAHIGRLDYAVGLLQNTIEALLFYHPAVWWISGRIRHERELAADELAASRTREPRRLAQALSQLELLQFAPQHLAPSATGGDLVQRIRRLTALAPSTSPTAPGSPGARPAAAPAPRWRAALSLLAVLAMSLPVVAALYPSVHGQAMAAERNAAGFAPAQLDFTTCRKPMYPPASLAAREEGTVHLRLRLDADGKVKAADIGVSSGHAALDIAARDAIRLCSAHPATQGGKPVATVADVRYVWTLN